MNLIYFIRLILKNVTLLVVVGVLMAVIVAMGTRNQPGVFSTETTIYTGIATGYNIETGANVSFDLFGTNVKFDNLINVIKLRETQEEVALRLMAQHLVMDEPDSRICSEETRNELLTLLPREVQDLVVKPGKVVKNPVFEAPEDRSSSISNLARNEQTTDTEEKESQAISNIQPEKTEELVNTPVYHTVKAGEYPALIARNYGLSLEQFIELNPGIDLNIHGGQRVIVGRHSESRPVQAASAASENRVTPAETLTKTTQASRDVNLNTRFDSVAQNFDKVFMDVIEQKRGPWEQTYQNLKAYKELDQSNPIFKILQSNHPYYSVEKISSIRVNRVQSSDLIRLTFESNDPGVATQTLLIMTEVFIQRFQSITAAQTIIVSDYFYEQMIDSKKRLDSLEKAELEYRKKFRIINYDEQSKAIAIEKESLDKESNLELGNFSAAKAALQSIEQTMGDRDRINLQNKAILDLRERLQNVTSAIAFQEVDGGDPDRLTDLKLEEAQLKIDLKNSIETAYASGISTAGMNRQELLTQWLDQVILVEQSNARYEVLRARQKEFMDIYDQFAPMGSDLNNLERQMNLVEDEYISNLNNYSLSITKQKNIEQSNLQVVDAPVFPLEPNPSKRLYLIVAAFIAGLGLAGALVIFLEFIDGTLKLPERASNRTGLKLIGAFPKLPAKPDQSVNYDLIMSRLTDLITQKIKIEDHSQRARGDQPFLMFVVSTRQKEGKTYVASKLVERLRLGKVKVLYVKPFEKKVEEGMSKGFRQDNDQNQVWDYEYEVPDNFMGVKSINELLRNFTLIVRGYQFIMVELPPLLLNEYPAQLTRAGNLTVMVCRANRSWNNADNEALDLYKSQINHPVMALLNGTQVDHLETIIGEIPKRRSKLRIWVKRLIRMDFRTAKSF